MGELFMQVTLNEFEHGCTFKSIKREINLVQPYGLYCA